MAKLPRDVIESLQKQVPRLIKRQFREITDEKFKKIKQDMIKEFLEHPVTVNLLDGPTAPPIVNGITNLYGFIGFVDGTNPIEPILSRFESIKINRDIPSSRRIGRDYEINVPTAVEIFAMTPMPWAEGRSWAKGIETGISGIGYLLRKNYKYEPSNSGVALQIKKKIRAGKYKNQKYISALINKYEKKFNNLK